MTETRTREENVMDDSHAGTVFPWDVSIPLDPSTTPNEPSVDVVNITTSSLLRRKKQRAHAHASDMVAQ